MTAEDEKCRELLGGPEDNIGSKKRSTKVDQRTTYEEGRCTRSSGEFQLDEPMEAKTFLVEPAKDFQNSKLCAQSIQESTDQSEKEKILKINQIVDVISEPTTEATAGTQMTKEQAKTDIESAQRLIKQLKLEESTVKKIQAGIRRYQEEKMSAKSTSQDRRVGTGKRNANRARIDNMERLGPRIKE